MGDIMSTEDRIAILETVIASMQSQINYISTVLMEGDEKGKISFDVISPHELNSEV